MKQALKRVLGIKGPSARWKQSTSRWFSQTLNDGDVHDFSVALAVIALYLYFDGTCDRYFFIGGTVEVFIKDFYEKNNKSRHSRGGARDTYAAGDQGDPERDVAKPLIQYIVNECVFAGIKEIVLVTHSSKNAIENHFDTSYELKSG